MRMSPLLMLLLTGLLAPSATAAPEIRVGSKQFTESVILGEIATQMIRRSGAPVVHRAGLGGTRTLWSALLGDEIDIYPEYTGTLVQEILASAAVAEGRRGLRRVLRRYSVRMSAPLGFNNSYALGMARERARKLGITRISDLAAHPNLRFGFSNEFMDRVDGWPGLERRYDLPQVEVRGLDHDLAYRGLAEGDIDVTDLYATDAEIRYYDLIVLEDDRRYFPTYEAVWLYHAGLVKAPAALRALQQLQGRIAESEMTAMNARAKLEGVEAAQLAAEFLMSEFGFKSDVNLSGVYTDLMRYTKEHVALVLGSLLSAIVIAVPLGVVAARHAPYGQIILAAVGVIQTIPALALLVFMIPLLGIGAPPAIVALFLYSLLPIVRNTYTGLREIPVEIRESAAALGLSPFSQLRRIELPIAMPTILAGIKTSAVINIGTATLGALVGAGGYGQPILTGIRLDDTSLILQGALPAAAMALLAQGLFGFAERFLVPRGLRL
jgi:osmoprotectant transport system permease protein